MIWRWVVLTMTAVIMAGCVTERAGVEFAGLSQTVGAPKPGQARIVVFRDTGYGGLYDQGWDLKLDGAPLKALKTGTYVYADRPAGRHQLSATMDMFMGVTRTDFTADAGRTYFFMAKPSERANAMTAMTMAGGLAGMVVAAAATSGNSNPGPLDFAALDDVSARAALNGLQLAP